jgi:hypothetical protein
MGDSATVEDVQARIERECRVSIFADVKRGRLAGRPRYEWVSDGAERYDADEPLEVRDLATGQTFMLEVRALPMGG